MSIAQMFDLRTELNSFRNSGYEQLHVCAVGVRAKSLLLSENETIIFFPINMFDPVANLKKLDNVEMSHSLINLFKKLAVFDSSLCKLPSKCSALITFLCKFFLGIIDLVKGFSTD